MNDVEIVEQAETLEVFRGHLDECVEHLKKCMDANAPKGLSGAMKARQPIADFCQTIPPTVAGWFAKRSKISGEFRIRMMCCLDTLGYRVLELEKLKNGKRMLAELIGYGLLTTQQAVDSMAYTEAKKLFRFIWEGKRTLPEKEERLYNICKEWKQKLQVRKQEMRERCKLGFSLMDSVRQRKVSAVMSIMEGLSSLLESKDVGEPFVDSLKDLSAEEKRTILHLADSLHEFSQKLAQQVQQ